jgi:hypothetical protein
LEVGRIIALAVAATQHTELPFTALRALRFGGYCLDKMPVLIHEAFRE